MELSESILSVTDSASIQMSKMISDIEDIDAIRIYVSGGGCGGMNYGMSFSEEKNKYDYSRKIKDFKVYIDAIAMHFLNGVEIDFVEQPTGAVFVFNNAFALTGGSNTCGACGSAGGGCA